MSLSRRAFIISGAAGLAALAVTPVLVPLLETDRERLMAQLRSGAVVRDQMFLIDEPLPIEIGGENLRIENCLFIWKQRPEGYLNFSECKGVRLSYCTFCTAEAYNDSGSWVHTSARAHIKKVKVEGYIGDPSNELEIIGNVFDYTNKAEECCGSYHSWANELL